jgi:type IV pilus assembly protein PilE
MLRRRRGFTLLELLIALVIVGVLLMSALPSYREHLLRTRRALARAELQKIVVRQEQFFIERRAYAASLTDLGYPSSPYAIDANGNPRLPSQGNGIYLIQLATAARSYTLYATPALGDPRCGGLSLDSLGTRAASGTSGVAYCW